MSIQGSARAEKGNLTVGSPAKGLILFALPMILGNIFQQLYNLFDSLIVGKMIDAKALAAVGASTAITMLFVMFAAGTGIGCSVVISQLFGARQIKEMKTSITTALITTLVFSLIMSVIGKLFSGKILLMMGTPADIFPSAKIYLDIYFYGFVFLFLYNMINAVFNALGASKIPLAFLMFSSLLNIGLDIVMVQKMGIAGAAWATLIAQALSAVLSFAVLVYKLRGMECGEHRLYDWELMSRMIQVAIPSIIQQSVVSIGMLLIQAAVNSQGAIFMAGYTAATRIDGIAIIPLVNMGNAVSTFVAQNMGAQKVERAKQGYHVGVIMGISFGVAIAVLVHFLGGTFVASFMDEAKDAASIAAGVRYLGIVSFFYFIFGAMNVTGSVLRGSGDMNWFMAQTLVNLFVRVLITYLFVAQTQGAIISWAVPVSWCCGLSISFLRYRTGKWQKIKLI